MKPGSLSNELINRLQTFSKSPADGAGLSQLHGAWTFHSPYGTANKMCGVPGMPRENRQATTTLDLIACFVDIKNAKPGESKALD